MKLYFTSRDNVGSKLIRWATNGDVSHVALGLGGSVYHSTEHGFKQLHFYDFEAEFKIVRSLAFNIPDDRALLALSSLIPNNSAYDFSAFAYFAWRAYLLKYRNVPMPKKNLWNSSGYLCTETAGAADKISRLLGCGPLLDDSIDLAITSPIELYYLLEAKAAGRWLCS